MDDGSPLSDVQPDAPTEELRSEPSPSETEASKLFKKWKAAIDRGRKAYGDADKVMDKILASCPVGTTVRTVERNQEIDLILIDQFATSNKVWAGSSCSRFKIDVQKVKPQDAKN